MYWGTPLRQERWANVAWIGLEYMYNEANYAIPVNLGKIPYLLSYAYA